MKLKLTNDQIVAMKMALDLIDNSNRQASSAPYKFPARGIYWIGRLSGKVKSLFDDIEKARVSLVEGYLERQKAEGITNESGLEGKFLSQFSREWQREILPVVVDVELPELKMSLLALDANPHLPTGVIRDLEPVLVDDLPAEEKEKK